MLLKHATVCTVYLMIVCDNDKKWGRDREAEFDVGMSVYFVRWFTSIN